MNDQPDISVDEEIADFEAHTWASKHLPALTTARSAVEDYSFLKQDETIEPSNLAHSFVGSSGSIHLDYNITDGKSAKRFVFEDKAFGQLISFLDTEFGIRLNAKTYTTLLDSFYEGNAHGALAVKHASRLLDNLLALYSKSLVFRTMVPIGDDPALVRAVVSSQYAKFDNDELVSALTTVLYALHYHDKQVLDLTDAVMTEQSWFEVTRDDLSGVVLLGYLEDDKSGIKYGVHVTNNEVAGGSTVLIPVLALSSGRTYLRVGSFHRFIHRATDENRARLRQSILDAVTTCTQNKEIVLRNLRAPVGKASLEGFANSHVMKNMETNIGRGYDAVITAVRLALRLNLTVNALWIMNKADEILLNGGVSPFEISEINHDILAACKEVAGPF